MSRYTQWVPVQTGHDDYDMEPVELTEEEYLAIQAEALADQYAANELAEWYAGLPPVGEDDINGMARRTGEIPF